MSNNEKSFLVRMWKFQFSFIDFRLNGLAGFAIGLMLAKVWDPILSLNWYMYLIVGIMASIKPLISFIKQI
tara:strand:+ start:2758 stop:2970 length:213 start_codon:yes stop_codon:yes gene_type:complete